VLFPFAVCPFVLLAISFALTVPHCVLFADVTTGMSKLTMNGKL
jgi:hypothetical protein